MGDGVGVIAKSVELVRRRAKQPFLFKHEPAQRQHAQADVESVVLILARDVKMGAGAFEFAHARVRRSLQLKFAQGARRIAGEDFRNQGHGTHRDDALFGVFFKIGIFTFGGGQAMIPLLQKELVVNLLWIPMKEFLDFVAISEITPGPVAINMATFVGYKLRGLTGALVTSLGVILPSFIIILIIATVAHTFRTNRWVSAFLDGLQPVVLALLTYAVYSIARGGIPAWWGYVASLGILLLILKYGKKLNLFLVLLAAGALGLLMFR